MSKKELTIAENLALAEKTARQAGYLLRMGFYEEKQIDTKSSSVDWVTEYDRSSEELIVNALLAQNPHHSVMGEEGSRIEGQSDYKWYIDPLDGTNNFAHQFPVFSISIALYQADVPLIGLVFDPLRDECFTSIKGEGSYLATSTSKQKLKVSLARELSKSLLVTGFPYDRHSNDHNNITELSHFLRTAQGIRRTGCAALDMAYVAAGRLEAYWEFRLYAWDMAAARLIVEEAGGIVSHPDGSPLEITEQLSLLVSNGHIHQNMLSLLAKASKERAGKA